MKKFFVLAVVLCLAAACTPNSDIVARVEFNGPLTKIVSPGIITIEGHVSNTGNVAVRLVRVFLSGAVNGWGFTTPPDLPMMAGGDFSFPFIDLDGHLGKNLDPTTITRRVDWDVKPTF